MTVASGALHAVTPYLMYRDAAGAIEFCRAAFGAVEVMRHVADDGRIVHAQLRVPGPSSEIDDALIMLSQATPAYEAWMPAVETRVPSPASLFIEVADADATVAKAIAHGASLIHPIGDNDYGRSGSVRDPFGYVWHVTSQPRA
jgi:uncharacterized glyoxalase superfamily protein PhnB